MDRPTFVVKRNARLAARLQMMAYCWRFARHISARVIVLWPPLQPVAQAFDGLEYSPSLLFDLRQFYENGGAEELIFLEGRIADPDGSHSVHDSRYASSWQDGFDVATIAQEEKPFFERLPIGYRFRDEPAGYAHFRTSLRETWHRLPHLPAVTRIIDDVAGRLDPHYAALHVRRGDIITTLRQELVSPGPQGLAPDRFSSILRAYLGRTAPFASYYDAIQAQIEQGRRIVFFSDSPETLEHFTARFGHQHFIASEKFARGRPPIQKAFVDFNLLMKADAIISTGSIYASFAAMLGQGLYANVVGLASVETMKQELHDAHLAGLSLDETARRLIDAEIERQGIEIDGTPGQLNVPPLARK